MKMQSIIMVLCLIFSPVVIAQETAKPKLFVGIVVDQMRAEYLYRFYDQFGNDGFKRLINNGYVCRNTHLNYIPSITAVGHASLYTGTTPRYHGIVGNVWYDRNTRKKAYCVEDSTERTVGADSSNKSASPRSLLSTSLLDELKISTNKKAQTISISLKDRAAVLSAGHMADGAFWLDLNNGNFVTSTYYMKELPQWIKNFNAQRKAFKYLENIWTLSKADSAYALSLPDDNNYEVILKGKQRPTFPYDLKKLAPLNSPYFEVLNRSPYGNSLLTDLAIDALHNTSLGKSGYTDYLAISFSSTDAVGHTYGPLSKEVNDTYLRLDLEIARLLNELDKTVGAGNYTVFLTADHGMAESTKYLRDNKVPAGDINFGSLAKEGNEYLSKVFGPEKWIVFLRNQQFFLDRELIRNKGLDLTNVQNVLANYMRDKVGISQVFTATQLDQQDFSSGIPHMVQNGFFYKRSGDVKLVYEPNWNDEDYETEAATTHSAAYDYDTHIPLIWYGAGIAHGESYAPQSITDIAPTVSMLLKIKSPSACTGQPITYIQKH